MSGTLRREDFSAASRLAEIVAHLGHVAVAHRAWGVVVAVDWFLQERHAVIRGGNRCAVDAQSAVGKCDNLFVLVAAEVGDVLYCALNARGECR